MSTVELLDLEATIESLFLIKLHALSAQEELKQIKYLSFN